MDAQSIIADTLLGKSIGGYQIVKRVGQSNLSTVYLAQSHIHGQAVIFTTFTLPERFSIHAREIFNERFIHVVSALTRLKHPHVAPVYDFGMLPEYLYMVTALTPADTLAALVQRQPGMSTTYVLDLMRQIADGIDYVHRSGVMHGSLSSGNIVLGSGQQAQIAGFGLVQILALSGIEALNHPYAHVLSVAMTFLGNPYSIAPEVVQGAAVDSAADIYALGVLLFEMLSGQPPFVEADPLKTALVRLNLSVPSIGELRPDLPLSLDGVLQKAMAYDPGQRYTSAGDLVQAFEQALREGNMAKQGVVLPGEGNVDSSTSGGAQVDAPHNRENIYQQGTGPLPAVSMVQAPTQRTGDLLMLWSPAALSVDEKQAFTWVGSNGQPSASVRPQVNKKRRRLVAALVTGGVVLGGLGTGGAVLAHILQGPSTMHRSAKHASASNISQPTSPPQPKKTIQPSPTPKPSPTPSHTGVVVGSTNQAVNSSTSFANPLDGNGSLLINLPSGNFVAFESACTHEGVRVYYDAGSHKIVCPRHNALFDPAQGAAVLQGPPDRALPSVPVHINSDGTVTVG